MDNLEMREEAATLRRQAAALERAAKRKLPPKWKVGMRVRYLRAGEWTWNKGTLATITKLDHNFKDCAADVYQVFWTSPVGAPGLSWWTTPEDVEWVPEKKGSPHA